ncbi:MAG: alkaline phosphatase family protein [Candidatus Micrarchaeaceae archaeon]
MAQRTAKKRLYLIGIDAAPLWLLKELEGMEGMEPFKKLIDSGRLGDLESVLPPMTGSAWPTIYTGLHPGEHGTPDFFVIKRDYVKDIVYYDSKAYPPFWKEFAEEGLKSLVITPATNIMLPDDYDVDIITGFPLRSRASSEKLRSLMKKCGFDGEPEIEKDMSEGRISFAEASKIYVKSVEKRSSIAKELIEKGDYDFVYVCFTETDRIQHFTLGRKERWEYILPVYVEIAKFVGYIEKRVETEDALMVIVSDHGAQPISEKFLLNAWLIKKGYLALKESVQKSISGKAPSGQSLYKVRERLMRSGLRKTYDKMPYAIKRATNKIVGSVLSKASPGEYTRLHLFDFDMKKTKAFAEVSNGPFAMLWINDRRFATPAVTESEKQRLIEEIKKGLSQERAGGKRIIAGFRDGEEYYGGTDKFIYPDLFIEAERGYTIDIFNYSPNTLLMAPEHAKSGDHIRNGIIGYYSNSARLSISGATVFDVAPTLLGYFGIKPAARGRNLLQDNIFS